MTKYLVSFFAGILMMAGSVLAQEANVFTYKVGAFEVSLLSEGQQKGRKDILIGASSEILQKYAPDGTFPNAVNTFLVRTPKQLILIDTGFGTKLFDNMKSLGVNPEQIDVVLITHMHGDHIGGMLREGKAAFPKAKVYIARKEYDYWMGDGVKNDNARKVVAAYKDQLQLFQPDELAAKANELISGIQGIAAYGHTPGHTVFLVRSEGSALLIWADLTHAMAVQMPHPEIAVTYDVNPQEATKSRKQVLEYVSENKIPIAGMHIAFPGIGKVSKAEEGFLFTPVENK